MFRKSRAAGNMKVKSKVDAAGPGGKTSQSEKRTLSMAIFLVGMCFH